ncbi:MAG: WYL domain-containing transcriptional regulator [Oscillospiraceae bacterium]|nr:WYL domain-containing transcriptional regulator [Oscillospiraceae bacterium]
MPKTENQKLKLLLLKDYLEQNTDEDHPATIHDLMAHLEANGVLAERKSIYRDIQLLTDFGCDIVATKGKTAAYYVAAGAFDLAELKLLADAVLASRFLTERKSSELLKKLGMLTSRHRAVELRRDLVVSGRVKAMNESVIYNVDALHEAIRTNSQIRFRYFEWDREKNRVFRKESRTASPWALCWDDANYYLVAHTPEHGITHFRVDKMTNIRQTGEPRVQTPETRKLDLASYGRQVFGMFNGSLQTVRMRFENRLAGVVIDRFGKDVTIVPDGEAHFICRAEVMVSPLFYGWLASFGGAVKLLSPDSVVEEFREQCATILAQYRKEASE